MSSRSKQIVTPRVKILASLVSVVIGGSLGIVSIPAYSSAITLNSNASQTLSGNHQTDWVVSPQHGTLTLAPHALLGADVSDISVRADYGSTFTAQDGAIILGETLLKEGSTGNWGVGAKERVQSNWASLADNSVAHFDNVILNGADDPTQVSTEALSLADSSTATMTQNTLARVWDKQVTGVLLSDSATLQADGATILGGKTGVEARNAAHATLRGAHVSGDSAGVLMAGHTKLDVAGGDITGRGSHVNLGGDVSAAGIAIQASDENSVSGPATLTLADNARVEGKGAGSTGLYLQGTSESASAVTAKDATVHGDTYGIATHLNPGAPLIQTAASTLELTHTTVSGGSGAALKMGSKTDTTITADQGTQLTGGNGNALEADAGSVVNLNVSGTTIAGNALNRGGDVKIALGDGAVWQGAMDNVSDLSVASNAQWALTGASDILKDVNNDGTIVVSNGKTPGTVLTVGDYSAHNGHLTLGSALGADNSATDKLVVKGNTSGTTLVKVNNLGGKGASTVDGIEIIQVGGQSAGQFTKDGRITAGAYDYDIVRGQGKNNANWYLSSDPHAKPTPPPKKIFSSMFGGDETVSDDERGANGTLEEHAHALVTGSGIIGTDTNTTPTMLKEDSKLEVQDGGTVLSGVHAYDGSGLTVGTQGRQAGTIKGTVTLGGKSTAILDQAHLNNGAVVGTDAQDTASLTASKNTTIHATDADGIVVAGNATVALHGSHVLSDNNAGLQVGGGVTTSPQDVSAVVVDSGAEVDGQGSGLLMRVEKAGQRVVDLVDATLDGIRGPSIEADSGTSTFNVSGKTQLQSGTHTLLDTHQGATTTLNLSDVQSGNITNSGTSHVNLTQGGMLKGTMQNVSDSTLVSGSEWDLSGASTLGSLTNGGEISIANGNGTGNTLTVNGDYTGNNGQLRLNGVLGGDGSAFDKLIVKGSTHGNTRVSINNVGGRGQQTIDGIEVVEVDGTSDGTFTTGDARITAGAYDYTLVKGNQKSEKNWYLTSESNTPVDPVVDVRTKTDVSGDRSGSPVTVDQGGQLTVSGKGKIGRQGAGQDVTSVLNSDSHLAVEKGGTVLGNIDARDNATLDLGTQGGATSTVSGGVVMEKHASGVFDSVNIGGNGVSLDDESSLTTGKNTFISTDSGNGISMKGNTRLRVNGSHVYSQDKAGIELGGADTLHTLPAGILASQREVDLVDATIQGLKAAAIEAKSGVNTIDVKGNSQLLSGNHTLLDTANDATVNLSLSDAQQGDILNQGISHVVLNQGARLTGAMQNVTDTTVAAGSEWDLTGDSTLTQGLVNDGVVSIAHGGQAGTSLTVAGNYTAQNGHLILNTRLGDDNSLTDKLVVKGNTSGNTEVTVNNAGGTGAKTVDGIEVVSVGGQSDGTFVSSGRITAGEYDYTLARGAGNEAKNWYLSSQLTGPAPDPQPVKIDKDVLSGTRWHLQGATVVNGNMRNSGDVSVATGQQTPGNTLTVKGNYIGNNGQMDFNTRLEGDASLTDKLVVTGNTSGRTLVQVNNLGGTGAKTLNGIELIDVGGKSDGDFISAGRITAGAYDYTLQRGAGQNSKNWYLDSELTNTPPQPGPEPVIHHVVRPEAGTYAANMQASNTLFAMDLQDRTASGAGARHSNGLWLRQKGEHNRFHDNSGQLTVTGDRYVAQLGGDLLSWTSNGTDQTVFGVMAGYGNSHNQANSQVSGYSSKGSVQGYSTGAYWTWRANAVDKTGLYADSWVQYNWFNNDVNGEKIAAEHYKSRGASASLELGDAILLGTSGSHADMTRYFIEPHAQATWMGVKADRHIEANGTTVKSEGENNVQTRVGMTAYLEKMSAAGVGYKPFVDMNWLHNTRAFGATMNGVSGTVNGARNAGEVGLGIEGNVTRALTLTASVSQQLGEKGYSDTSGELGMKYTF